MSETWLPVVGFEGLYEVCDQAIALALIAREEADGEA
jgi:hypothetical protein